ncbi:hypothetical protein [Caulobacter segnis]|uniref:hypothetical protein n=1 Tax=Caulobacter segnis TaxID=88688 RepID=UPI001CBEAC41|nr:hypothetical protein [Caulobacter segnis]UAL12094.1 hypothetical protein K8940_07400 [Caulobacter segnis]
MFKRNALALVATLGLMGANTAQAQVEQDPVARLNQLGRYAGQATVCGEFGFKVHQERVESYANSAIALGARAGFSETLSYTYVKNAMDNAMRQAQRDIAAMSQGDNEDEASLAQNVRGQARKIIAACREVARDPAGRTIVTDSSLSDDILLRNATDELLMPTGYASWQTPYMRAGADMIQAVTVCKTHLTRAQSDAYVAELYAPNRFPAAVENKARAYFEFWKRRDEMSDVSLDATQCNRLLTARADKLKAAR